MVVAVGTPAAAVAAMPPTPDVTAVSQIRDALPTAERVKFDKLSPADQADFVRLLSDPDAYEVRVTEEPVVVTTPAALRTAAAATTRTYSKVNKLDFYMFGIAIGNYRQEIRYNVAGTSTKKPHYCKGTFTGWSGFWNISQSSSSFVENNKAYCRTDYQLSAFFKDNAIQLHKRQQQVGTNKGVVSHSVGNL